MQKEETEKGRIDKRERMLELAPNKEN